MVAGSVVTAIPGLGSILPIAPAQATEPNGALTDAEVGAAGRSGPLVAHVSDVKSGEIRIYNGESQVVVKNPALAARLFRANPEQGR